MRPFIQLLNLLAPQLAILLWLGGVPWYGWALVLTPGHALWLWATLVPKSKWWGAQLSKLPLSGKKVWITIDDGPDPDDTPKLLSLLDAHGAKATFFVIGDRAERYPELIRSILAAGHGIGNHTYSHPAGWFWSLGRRGVIHEIAKCSEVLLRIAPSIHLKWFRAPAGMRNHHVHPILNDAGLELAGWSVRGRDGVSKDLELIVSRLKRGIAEGAILLMHEGRVDTHGERLAPQVLGKLLLELKAKGYEAVLPAD